jgi:tellurite resistance protein TerC
MRRRLRRLAVAVIGGIVLVIGLVMTILPGPAILIIPAGLAILASEFPWARRLLDRVRQSMKRVRRHAGAAGSPPEQAPPLPGEPR